jgi:2-phosphosulpholactate phosphatase
VEIRFVGIEDCASIDGVAVVVDVLRTFSFAAYALDCGADRVILVEDLDEALRLAAEIPGALAGKDGVPAEGSNCSTRLARSSNAPTSAAAASCTAPLPAPWGAVAAAMPSGCFAPALWWPRPRWSGSAASIQIP